MKYFGLFLFILMIPQIYASCDNNQIDINSASISKLDEIIWIGPATAEKIIDARPFENLDSLTKISGIGEVKLQDIKEQGLACVEEEEFYEKEEEKIENNYEREELVREEKEIPNLEIIRLDTKSIKSEENKENLDKINYAAYGLGGFCVLLGILFLIRRQKYRKNEFR